MNFVTINYITGKLRIIENTGEKNCSGCFYFEGKIRKSKLSLEKKIVWLYYLNYRKNYDYQVFFHSKYCVIFNSIFACFRNVKKIFGS